MFLVFDLLLTVVVVQRFRIAARKRFRRTTEKMLIDRFPLASSDSSSQSEPEEDANNQEEVARPAVERDRELLAIPQGLFRHDLKCCYAPRTR